MLLYCTKATADSMTLSLSSAFESCREQPIGSDDRPDGSVRSSDALLFHQGCPHLDSEKGCKLRVGGDLALLRFRLGTLV